MEKSDVLVEISGWQLEISDFRVELERTTVLFGFAVSSLSLLSREICTGLCLYYTKLLCFMMLKCRD